MLIPHTRAVTTLGQRPVGAAVNLEFDVLAKHGAALDPAAAGVAVKAALSG